MWKPDNLPELISNAGLSALSAGSIWLFYLLPAEVLTVLAVWTLASFPIGILIGHYGLSEEVKLPPQ